MCQDIKLATAMLDIATPFGRPVDPEVNKMYARLPFFDFAGMAEVDSSTVGLSQGISGSRFRRESSFPTITAGRESSIMAVRRIKG